VIIPSQDGVYIDIQVQPKARRPGVRGVHDQRLKIGVVEPAKDGRANEAAVEAVASLLNVSSGTVSLVAGTTSRRKRVFVQGIDPDQALRLISAAIRASDPG
jgi:uncharacterized protein (TIGR00251 family)